MIASANMELYVQLLREYTACPMHTVQAKTAGESDDEKTET